MNFKITTLAENTVSMGLGALIGEHGLSFYIETGNRKILFDTGQGLGIVNNAAVLGIDLSQIDTVVLSHGHYDHTKGLKNLVSKNNKFSLFAHTDVFENKLIGGGGMYLPIGFNQEKAILDEAKINIKLDKKPMEIAPGIMTTGEIPMETDFEKIEPMFFKGDKNKEACDNILDDMALILDTQKGLVVVLGCTHRGIINTLNHVVSLTGKKKIYAIMGGLHLAFADKNKLAKIAGLLRDFDIQKMIVGHCTGFYAMAELYNNFGEKFIPNAVGYKIEF